MDYHTSCTWIHWDNLFLSLLAFNIFQEEALMFPWEPKRCMTWSTHWTSSVRMVTMSLILMCIWWPLQLLAPQTGWNENKYGYTLKEQVLLSYKLACKNQELNRLPLSAEERLSAEQQEACLHFSNFRTLLELRINEHKWFAVIYSLINTSFHVNDVSWKQPGGVKVCSRIHGETRWDCAAISWSKLKCVGASSQAYSW